MKDEQLYFIFFWSHKLKMLLLFQDSNIISVHPSPIWKSHLNMDFFIVPTTTSPIFYFEISTVIIWQLSKFSWYWFGFIIFSLSFRKSFFPLFYLIAFLFVYKLDNCINPFYVFKIHFDDIKFKFCWRTRGIGNKNKKSLEIPKSSQFYHEQCISTPFPTKNQSEKIIQQSMVEWCDCLVLQCDPESGRRPLDWRKHKVSDRNHQQQNSGFIRE